MMNIQEVIDLMKSSRNVDEWNDNCDKVKDEQNVVHGMQLMEIQKKQYYSEYV